jgi:glycosyltransferase involved in cell wall biosynthesis
MPVVVLGTTEAARAVPPEAGAISTNVDELVHAAAQLVRDPAEARQRGNMAREAVLERYGLDAFLRAWNELLEDLTSPRFRTGRILIPTQEGKGQ